MSHRRLDRDLTAWRIGDPQGEFPIWSDGGARRTAGRWHETGAAVIYASLSYSTAMLEKLVHFNGVMPSGQHFIAIRIPTGTAYETVNPDLIEGWAEPNGNAARAFAAAWYREKRSAVLIVPSVVARMERNVVFNTLHPDFSGIEPGLETPVWWDARLFSP